MLSNGSLSCTYDSANRLLTAGGNTYTYNAEDVRIKNVHYGVEEQYTYNTNCKLSKVLMRTVGTTVTKYVYGLGLISEETNNTVKVYHFDYRGSTVAVTDTNGNISDTFVYDTYGKITSRVGSSDIIFCYNGRDGVVTDTNGLFYMRARYYSPDMRRFVNADIIAGEISEAITINRYAYANGNPVSNVDPFGLSPERENPYGSIIYNDSIYSIYIPNHLNMYFDSVWETIAVKTISDISFDFSKFISEVSFDDMNGAANSTNSAFMTGKNKGIASGISIIGGILSSALNSFNGCFLTYTFQESGDKKRVIISVGSMSAKSLFDSCADNIPRSVYFSYAGAPFYQIYASKGCKNFYFEYTGNQPEKFKVYDYKITVDSSHKGSSNIAYLGFDGEGNMMLYPILYPNDKVEVGIRSGFLDLKFDSLLTIPLDEPIPVSAEISDLFDKGF